VRGIRPLFILTALDNVPMEAFWDVTDTLPLEIALSFVIITFNDSVNGYFARREYPGATA